MYIIYWMRYFVNKGRLDFKSLKCYNNHTLKKTSKKDDHQNDPTTIKILHRRCGMRQYH